MAHAHVNYSFDVIDNDEIADIPFRGELHATWEGDSMGDVSYYGIEIETEQPEGHPLAGHPVWVPLPRHLVPAFTLWLELPDTRARVSEWISEQSEFAA